MRQVKLCATPTPKSYLITPRHILLAAIRIDPPQDNIHIGIIPGKHVVEHAGCYPIQLIPQRKSLKIMDLTAKRAKKRQNGLRNGAGANLGNGPDRGTIVDPVANLSVLGGVSSGS